MIPLGLVVAGLVALAAGWLAMRSLGAGARVGRILAATRTVEMGRAIEFADAGTPRYVAVGGRLDSAEPWDDDAGRPLVFQRSRLELFEGGRWRSFAEERRTVPFEVTGALETLRVDSDALEEGLVVVTRESEGTASDVPDRVPEGTDPATRVRLRVEFLSVIDHALVLGVPVRQGDAVVIGPGLGRPLIVTTLEPAEAMRLLAAGRQGLTRTISVLLGAGAVGVGLGVVWAVVDALG